MKINTFKKVAVVNSLVDVETKAVSLVNYGANEQGFKIVKNSDEYTLDSKRLFDNIGDCLMAVSPKRIEFDANVFPSMESVEKFLTDNNYSDVTIIEKSGMFVAHSSDEALDLETGEPLALVDGVVAYLIEEDEPANVSKAEELEPTEEDVSPASPEPSKEEVEAPKEDVEDETACPQEEVENAPAVEDPLVVSTENEPSQEIKKFDYWTSYSNDSGDFIKNIRSGVDGGLPPSFEYISEVHMKCQISAIVKGDRSLYSKNNEDYLKYMSAMLQVYTDIVEMSQENVLMSEDVGKSADVETQNQLSEVLKRLKDVEETCQKLTEEKKTVEEELQKSKEQVVTLESQLEVQDNEESTIQKRKVVARVSDAPKARPFPLMRVGEDGKLQQAKPSN